MLYTITEKNQAAIDGYYGGGSRYVFILTTRYPEKEGMDDHMTTRITVSEEVFNSYQIGDKINLQFSLADANA